MIPSSFFESHPKNVCPSCGERAEWKRSFESGRPGFNTLFACQSCGATCRQCEIRYLTDEERAESAERQRESKRERAREATVSPMRLSTTAPANTPRERPAR